MSFPSKARRSLYKECLIPLWEEMGVAVSKDYHQRLQSMLYLHAGSNPVTCKKYMELVNTELLDAPLPDILEGEEFHPALQRFFYARVYGRLVLKLRSRNLSPADYFNEMNQPDQVGSPKISGVYAVPLLGGVLNKLKQLGIKEDQNSNHAVIEPLQEDERNKDISDAIREELAEITTIHELLMREAILQDPPERLIKAYKHKKTWFKDVNDDFVLEVVEVLMDAADKGNSLGNKISQQLPKTKTIPHPAHTPDSTGDAGSAAHADTKPPFMVSEFQIAGIVISFFYLFLSVLTPLYKKFVLKRDDPLINRWSLRYFIPAVILFGLGVVALTVSGVGIWIGLGFAIYSIASNIFKVGVYFKYYFDLKKQIKENLETIPVLQKSRDILHDKIKREKEKYKNFVQNGRLDLAANSAACMIELEKEHQALSIKWLDALASQEELEIKRTRTLDKFTGVANLIRLGLAIAGCIGVILTVIPFTMPVGVILSFTVLCVGTVILVGHHVNKFHLIKKEKSQAKAKRDEFKPEFEKISTHANVIKQLNATDGGNDLLPGYELVPVQSADPMTEEKVVRKICPSVIDLLLSTSKSGYHPDPDPDERPGGTTLGVGV